MLERVQLLVLSFEVFVSELVENVAGVPKPHPVLSLHYCLYND